MMREVSSQFFLSKQTILEKHQKQALTRTLSEVR